VNPAFTAKVCNSSNKICLKSKLKWRTVAHMPVLQTLKREFLVFFCKALIL
jgi:hypothetical protein